MSTKDIKGVNLNVKGLSIQDIMSMDWNYLNQLSSKEMKQLTSRLVSAANKRIRRLQKTELGNIAPSLQGVKQRGRAFSVKGKNTNQVRNEFKMARNFLNMKTSTVSGWKDLLKRTYRRVKDTTGYDPSTWDLESQQKFWKVYKKFEEMYGGTFRKGDSDRIQKMLMDLMDNTETMSEDELLRSLEDKYIDLYEDEEMEDILPDDYFDIDF